MLMSFERNVRYRFLVHNSNRRPRFAEFIDLVCGADTESSFQLGLMSPPGP